MICQVDITTAISVILDTLEGQLKGIHVVVSAERELTRLNTYELVGPIPKTTKVWCWRFTQLASLWSKLGGNCFKRAHFGSVRKLLGQLSGFYTQAADRTAGTIAQPERLSEDLIRLRKLGKFSP